MTLELADLDGFGTVIVTSADVTGRPVGKRVSVDVFRKVVHEGSRSAPASSAGTSTSGRDPCRSTPGTTPGGTTSGSSRTWGRCGRPPGSNARRSAWPTSPRWVRTSSRRWRRARSSGGRSSVSRRPGLTAQVASELEFALYHGSYDEGRANGYETLVPDHARAGRLHDPGRRPVRGLLLGRSGRARRLRARPVDQPGRVGPRPVGDQPRVPAGARDGRPAPAVQARDAHARVERGHGGHVHGAAVRRHDRLVVPPASLARRRRRPQRVPRRRGRRRDLGDAPARDRRRAAARARAHAVLRADRELLPPDDERRVLGQRAVVGVRQPDGLVPCAHRVARVHPARMARARRRRGPVPRDRGAPRLGARRDRERSRARRAADGRRLRAPGRAASGHARRGRSNASATARSRPRRWARTWWRTTPRPGGGSGSSSCPPAPSASGNAAATSTSSEEAIA